MSLSILVSQFQFNGKSHNDVIKWKHFPRHWPFVRGIHLFLVNSLHKGQWRGALMFSLICAWVKGWVNNREAGDLRCHSAHYDVNVMIFCHPNFLHLQFQSDGNPYLMKWSLKTFGMCHNSCAFVACVKYFWWLNSQSQQKLVYTSDLNFGWIIVNKVSLRRCFVWPIEIYGQLGRWKCRTIWILTHLISPRSLSTVYLL